MSKNALEDFLGMQITQLPDALCREFDPELFYAEPGGKLSEQAKAICSFCAQSDQCRDDARSRGERYGVFGGEDAQERIRFLMLGEEKFPRYSPVNDLMEIDLPVNQIAQRLGIPHD